MEEITMEGLSVEKFEQLFGKVRPNVCKTLTQDLFGYKSVSCLECDGTGEEPNTENTCDECDGTGEIII